MIKKVIAIISIIAAAPTLFAMEPVDYLPELPTDIKNEIFTKIANSSDPEEAGRHIRSLRTVNKAWKNWTDEQIYPIIQSWAKRFKISESLAALQLGIESAVNWWDKNKPAIDQSVTDLVQAQAKFPDLKQTKAVTKVLSDRGIVLHRYELPFKGGVLKNASFGIVPGKVSLVKKTGELDTTWGQKGQTEGLGNFQPSAFFQKKNGLIVVAGVEYANGVDSLSFVTLDDKDGAVLERIDRVIRLNGYMPSAILSDPDTGRMIIVARTGSTRTDLTGKTSSSHKYAIIQENQDGTFSFKEIPNK